MYSKIEDKRIFETSLNDNPNPILIISKDNYDILYWNVAYRVFLINYFKIAPDGLENISQYPQDLHLMFLDLVEKIKDELVHSYETELGETVIKTQIVNSTAYFILFVDVTQVRKLLDGYKKKHEELKEVQKNKRELLMKNIRLWSIISSKITQVLFGVIVFFGILGSLVKDYYLNRYEKEREEFAAFIADQNAIKLQMLESINKANETNTRALQIIELREREILSTIKDMKRVNKENQETLKKLIKRHGISPEF